MSVRFVLAWRTGTESTSAACTRHRIRWGGWGRYRPDMKSKAKDMHAKNHPTQKLIHTGLRFIEDEKATVRRMRRKPAAPMT